MHDHPIADESIKRSGVSCDAGVRSTRNDDYPHAEFPCLTRTQVSFDPRLLDALLEEGETLGVASHPSLGVTGASPELRGTVSLALSVLGGKFLIALLRVTRKISARCAKAGESHSGSAVVGILSLGGLDHEEPGDDGAR